MIGDSGTFTRWRDGAGRGWVGYELALECEKGGFYRGNGSECRRRVIASRESAEFGCGVAYVTTSRYWLLRPLLRQLRNANSHPVRGALGEIECPGQ
jgi:hypothetical protein